MLKLLTVHNAVFSILSLYNTLLTGLAFNHSVASGEAKRDPEGQGPPNPPDKT